MANYGRIIGMTKQECPRCGDKNQKAKYRKSGEAIVRCRNCGHSWKSR